MTIDTEFDLASVSKVMGVASACAALVDRKWIDWNLRVSSVFPNYPHRDIRASHLLSHTSGLQAWHPLFNDIRARFGGVDGAALRKISIADRQRAMRELVFSFAPEAPIESRFVYSDFSFLILGFMIEEVTQMPLDRAIQSLVIEPMRLERTSYIRISGAPENPLKEKVLKTAATEDSPWRGGVLQREVNDENTWSMGGYAGHAGLFAPIHDVLLFARRWMTGHFSDDTRKVAWLRLPRPQGCERTLGWDTPSAQNALCGNRFSQRSVGHYGFTGTSLWIDPTVGIAAVLLTNRVHESNGLDKIRALRPAFHNTLREELGF